MITGDLKRRIDALWTEFWQGGITNPLTVIEQITFLMFARLLDINETRDENRLKRTGKSFERRFSDDEQSLRWSQFRHLGSDAMLPLVRDKVFPHFRKSSTSGTAFAEFMKDAQLMIQKPSLLVKAVNMIDQLPLSVMALIGVATAAAGIVFAPYVPDAWTIKIGAQAIDGILNVLASSMLVVTVFSMSTMVAAYGAATSNVTPRATKLLMEDNTSQNVLGTFIGSFLFSLVGIIALSTGLYGSQGRAILLIVTIGLIALIAVTILRWIDYLARFGRLGETIQRVEEATWQAMKARLSHPYLGGLRLASNAPDDAHPVFAKAIGYVQHVDVAALEDCAKAAGCEVFVAALPGVFADPARPVAMVSGPKDDEVAKAVTEAFTVGAERTFDQDPRFGLCVLAEIASRALSPAVNDPGTAIDVIGRAVRLLAQWGRFEASEIDADVSCPHVWVPAIEIGDMFDDVFAPIARDGAGMLEIQLRLQNAFLALTATDTDAFGAAARRHAATALKRAEAALTLEDERRSVRAVAAKSATKDERAPG